MYVSECSSFYLGTILQSLRPWIWRMWANISSLSSWKSRFNFSKLLFNNLGSGGWKCPWSGGIDDTAQSRAKHDSAQWALIGGIITPVVFPTRQHAIGWVTERAGDQALLLALYRCIGIVSFHSKSRSSRQAHLDAGFPLGADRALTSYLPSFCLRTWLVVNAQ